MYHRQTTPPSGTKVQFPDSAHGRNVSYGSHYAQDSSPDSITTVATNITTPPRSPIRQHVHNLLPKIRCQEQITEPTTGPVRHRRTPSSASSSFQNSLFPYTLQRPGMSRRATSPPEQYDLSAPSSAVSAPSPYWDSLPGSALNSPINFTSSQPPQPRRPSFSQSRSRSSSAIRSHSRSGSASSIDESGLRRFGFPTYRQMPQYVTNTGVASSTVTHVPSPVDFLAVQSIPQAVPMQKVQSMPSYSCEPDFPYDSTPQTSLLEYLTAENPSPRLVERIVTEPHGMQMYTWFDVRNLRSWSDFNINTITSIPLILPLLKVPVSCANLPTPPHSNPILESEAALHDLYRTYHLPKINAALKLAQGDRHMVMRSSRTTHSSRLQPDFISNYASDYEKTIHGDGRGRVVGIVKAYDQWNTGMRAESGIKPINYLKGLAHLHYLMREHGCRYGFIVNEIELLCVRCGGPNLGSFDETNPMSDASIPLFGYLETAAPIRLSTHVLATTTSPNPSSVSDGSDASPQPSHHHHHHHHPQIQITASIALWYLHMLAKESPFEGMGSWRMEVGGPAACTRQNCLERDAWMPKVLRNDMRNVRTVRGWVYPTDPLCRKERGRKKNRAA